MPDSPAGSDAADEPPGPAAHPGMPRWAKVFCIAAGSALLVAFVLMHTIGGGTGGR